MTPLTRNLVIYRGDTFSLTVTFKTETLVANVLDPVDLTGATARAQIRPTADSDEVLAEFDCEVDGPTGTVTVTLTPEQTTDLVNGLWDLQLTFSSGVVRTFLKGSVTTLKEITRV